VLARVDVRTEVVATGSSEPPFDELYARLAPSAGRLAYLLTGDRELAEDLVHDAFIKTVGRWERIRNPEAFDAYLRRTIINLTRSHHRRRLVERRYLRAWASEPETADPQGETSLDLPLRRALLSLPPRQRAAVVLRYHEDLSEAQTAELMVVSVGTVKSLTSRGMAKLREVMGDDDA
jgi:RNA polymerase sigma-70 factor (sigma-E family)